MVAGFWENYAAYESHLDDLGCTCEPKVIRAEKVYEGTDEDGRIEYSTDYIYNCEECDCEECKDWSKYNNKEERK